MSIFKRFVVVVELLRFKRLDASRQCHFWRGQVCDFVIV